MAPDLAEAARRLAAAGASRIDVVPLFLGTGGHLRNDLPPLVEAVRGGAARRCEIRLHPAIGENDGGDRGRCASRRRSLPRASVNNPRLQA